MSDSKKTRWTRIWALMFVVLCSLLLCGAVLMRRVATHFQVDDVRLAPRWSLATPEVACIVEGTNPLPFALSVSDLTVTLFSDRLGADIQAELPDQRSIPAGHFEMALSIPHSLSAVRLVLHRPDGEEGNWAQYRIEMSVGMLWFKKSVVKSGSLAEVISSSVEGVIDGR